jgi:hypothetical protein
MATKPSHSSNNELNMAAQQPIPPSIEQLGTRPFSFFPPILEIEYNEWTFREATWSEVLVENVKTHQEIWVPKRFIGEVARVDDPMAIVGLNKELEYRAGSILPHVRRVIEMPRAVNEGPRPGATPSPDVPKTPTALQALTGVSNSSDSKIGKMLLVAIGTAILLVVIVVAFFNDADKRVRFSPVVQSDITFSERDDYFAIERRLGKPAEDKWKSDQGEIQFRYLWYPQQQMAVILMGTERGSAAYIGELDKDGRVIHSTDRNTEQILRRFKKP